MRPPPWLISRCAGCLGSELEKIIARILGSDHAGEGAATSDEGTEITFFNDTAGIKDDDAARVADGAEAVGNGNHGAPGRETIQRFLD